MRRTLPTCLPALLALVLAACSGAEVLPDPGPPAATLDPRASMRVHFIDVGQGNATLFEFPCGAMLVDLGGEQNAAFDGVQALRSYLTAFFERRADLQRTLALVAVTHPLIDHVRGASFLLAIDSPFKIQNIITNGQESSSGAEELKRIHLWAAAEQIPLARIAKNDVLPMRGLSDAVVDPIQCPGFDPDIRVLYSGPELQPTDWERRDFENLNNRSMVLRVDFGETSVLLLSDLEKTGRSVLLSTMIGSRALDVDIVQAARHGGGTGPNREFMDEVTPEVAVISVGPSSRQAPGSAWELGYPNKVAVTRLVGAVRGNRERPLEAQVAVGPKRFEPLRIERAIYATGWDGTLVFEAGLKGSARRVAPDGAPGTPRGTVTSVGWSARAPRSPSTRSRPRS
ncbi:MAG TPA: hypothetical protein PK668_27240 [Myxococcota bacterium]|nr:hypothetical protein [Myxococcota bacterium]HRY97222.1 hypothetical protein [Myxococcota bacterium]HSA20657.1 hypothetical protein [Myxococcota bacterium]